MYNRVIVGGTFETLHKGHRKLLRFALSSGRRVYIGLTSDEFTRKNKKYSCSPFVSRKKRLEKFLGKKVRRVEIFPLHDVYGPTIDGNFDAIAVSEETRGRAEEINMLRRSKGLKPLEILAIPLFNSDDLKKLSCERIKEGEVDDMGRVKNPILLAVGSTNPAKLKGVEKVARKIFKNFKIRGIKVKSKIPGQPFDDETVKGAVNRARIAKLKLKGDYGVGLESGLFRYRGKYYDCLVCAVYDGERVTIGYSMAFEIPRELAEEMESTEKTMSKLFEEVSGISEIGKKKGAIGYLSKGLAKRSQMAEQAFLCAMIPRMSR
ncbi:inosine/xanthosine triphosphatase [Candidatus Micrarchaeota archaeon]|nr:inosine/xanthosine triphosphatase [Candidatus Micrarchaeota archaeon]